jgi:NAD(P)-dependent dehydrogenase (short-subunit alcohol dehydrogenase family)
VSVIESETGRLRDRTIVFTGAGRGLGRAATIAIGLEGAHLVLCDRVASELARTKERLETLGARVETSCFDLADREALLRFARSLRDRTHGIDGIVNNAGVLHRVNTEETSDKLWDETLAVNTSAPFLLTREMLPVLRERGGSIVNVSSRAGIRGFAEQSAYCASKFALEGWTRALAAELEREGARVSVNTITPGTRIKPTMMTSEEEAALPEAERGWGDGSSLGPAFVCLLEARGTPTGLRFNAASLSEAIALEGAPLPSERLKELAE